MSEDPAVFIQVGRTTDHADWRMPWRPEWRTIYVRMTGSNTRAVCRIDGVQRHYQPAAEPVKPSKHRASKQPRAVAVAARRRRRRLLRKAQKGTR